MGKIRFLPVLILVMVLFFGFRAYDFAVGVEQVFAANAGEPVPEMENPTARDLSDVVSAAGDKAEGQADPAGEATDTHMDDDEGFVAGWSRSEVQLLQELSERREVLEGRAKEMDIREKLLEATENRIDQKIASLKKIEAQIQGLLKAHDEREQAQLESLVKTYTAMKPKDAARIFDSLDMDILINIIENMNEKKVAPILAKMSSQTAKELTVELATRRQMPDIEG
ncbi:MotE family protein [Emcibacter sp.]|uniref:MotE family protein n=1 Tax=Emcibacter sp. TaxID=1979954 RepID=UPI003A8D8BAE